MGAWGYGVMQSDDALDLAYELEGHDLSNTPALLEFINGAGDYVDKYGVSPAMVVAYTIMENRYPLPVEILSACEEEYRRLCEQSESFGWSDPDARDKALEKFVDDALAYEEKMMKNVVKLLAVSQDYNHGGESLVGVYSNIDAAVNGIASRKYSEFSSFIVRSIVQDETVGEFCEADYVGSINCIESSGKWEYVGIDGERVEVVSECQ